MANSTSTQRRLWAPACKRHGDLIDAYEALDACFEAFGYEVGPGSGAANCRPITGGTDYSLHAYAFGPSFSWWNGRKFAVALAVDINPSKNPYGPRLVTDMPRPMIDTVTAVQTRNGKQVWVWGGYFTPNHDAMHFQIGCSPADLATGIDPATVPGGSPVREEDDMEVFEIPDDDDFGADRKSLWLRVGHRFSRIANPGEYAELKRLLPGRGLDKPTKIDNAVIWSLIKTGGKV